jgi:hypothetical protein
VNHLKLQNAWRIKQQIVSYIYEFLMINLDKGNSYKQMLNDSFFLMTEKSLLDGCKSG